MTRPPLPDLAIGEFDALGQYAFFDNPVEAHASRLANFSPRNRAGGAGARVAPPIPEVGGRDLNPRRMSPADPIDMGPIAESMVRMGQRPTPQQRRLVSLMESRREDGRPRYAYLAVQVPRRSGKTSAIFGAALHRCLTIPGYTVGYAAQTGQKSRRRFLDLGQALDRYWPDPADEEWRLLRSNSDTRIILANGSQLIALPPDPEAFRGDAYDLAVLDEAQEVGAEDSAELMGGVLPTMDTRPLGQIVIAGTTGKLPEGLLWDALAHGQDALDHPGASRWGILDYSADPDTEVLPPRPDKSVPRQTIKLAESVHPGIGTLTTTETVIERLLASGVMDWSREYLGLWPRSAATLAFDAEGWEATTRDMCALPRDFALSFDVTPDGEAAALVAAWHETETRPAPDEDDEPTTVRVQRFERLHLKAGYSWLIGELLSAARLYALDHEGERCPLVVAYDNIGKNAAVATDLARELTYLDRDDAADVALIPLTTKDMVQAAQRITQGVRERTVTHTDDIELDNAARAVVWRGGDYGRLFDQKRSGAAISPLVAASTALQALMTAPQLDHLREA